EFSAPWPTRPESIDLPVRFGSNAFSRWDYGQSTLDADLGRVTLGFSTENEWWGPGIRNAIVMSTNAAGIPRLFVRTTRPVVTRIGTFEARLFAGALPAGVEVYAEWGRNELPTSLRDFLTAPNHTQGYTLGLQWAQSTGTGSVARIQLEATYLEKSATLRDRPVGTWYTSRAVAQG